MPIGDEALDAFVNGGNAGGNCQGTQDDVVFLQHAYQPEKSHAQQEKYGKMGNFADQKVAVRAVRGEKWNKPADPGAKAAAESAGLLSTEQGVTPYKADIENDQYDA